MAHRLFHILQMCLPNKECREFPTLWLLLCFSHQSFESDVTTHSAAVPEKSTMGFQRFLEVLNKGVNVDTLTQIVTRSSPEEDDRPQSPTSFTKTDNPWSPGYAGMQQESHWSNGPQRQASPLPPHQSFSPKRCPLSDEESLQRGECSNSRSRSPPVVEKIPLTPEEEHKHRQMQDVLLAIGMDLGSDELGQMSHRIQERLYGKKDTDGRPLRRASRERETKRAVSPRQQGRSSSSRSSFSPSLREYYNQKDLYSAQRENTEVDQVQVQEAVDYAQNSSSSALQQSEKCQTYSQDSNAACQPIPQNPAYNYPPPTPGMPMYPPVNSSPQPYPGLPPNMPHFRPGQFMPRPPPFFPYPSVPPVNIFPGVLPQTRQLLPQNMGNPSYFNTFQPLNIAQRKTITRTRCLQVIDTKQPG